MNPRTEFADLVSRSRKLTAAALVLIISFALLIVSAGTLFATVFITVFRTAQGAADRMTAKVTVPELLR